MTGREEDLATLAEAEAALRDLGKLIERLDRRIDAGRGIQMGAALLLVTEFGTALRVERKRRGLPLVDAARQIGVQASILGAYERAERWPGRAQMERIGQWLADGSMS